jgi:hypothetical protein
MMRGDAEDAPKSSRMMRALAFRVGISVVFMHTAVLENGLASAYRYSIEPCLTRTFNEKGRDCGPFGTSSDQSQ